MVIEVDSYGAIDLMKAMRALPVGLQRWCMGPGCKAAADVIAANLRKTVPIGKTGGLHKSIRVIRIKDFLGERVIKGGKSIVVYGGKGARQAPLLEWGTVKIEERNYLRKATSKDAQAQHDAFIEYSARAFKRTVENIAKRRVKVLERAL